MVACISELDELRTDSEAVRLPSCLPGEVCRKSADSLGVVVVEAQQVSKVLATGGAGCSYSALFSLYGAGIFEAQGPHGQEPGR